MNYTLDAGALIGLERGRDEVVRMVQRTATLTVPSTVVAQVWRSPRQVVLSRFLSLPHVEIAGLDGDDARAIGLLLAASGSTDVVDAHVVLTAALRNRAVVTSDPDDLLKIDPRLELLVV